MASYQSTVLADGAQSLWPQGEPSGTVANDVGPAASNGTYNNPTGVTLGVSAPIGIQPTTAANYEPLANNGYMTAPAVAANSPVDVFTLEIWFLTHNTGFTRALFTAKRGTASPTGAPAIMMSGGNQLQIGGSGAAFTLGTVAQTFTNTTVWNYVAWSKNGATNIVVVNGVNVTPAIANQTFTAFTAGAQWVVNSDGGSALPNQICDMSFSMPAVYTSAISTAKMITHYQIGTNTLPPVGGAGGIRYHHATR